MNKIMRKKMQKIFVMLLIQFFMFCNVNLQDAFSLAPKSEIKESVNAKQEYGDSVQQNINQRNKKINEGKKYPLEQYTKNVKNKKPKHILPILSIVGIVFGALLIPLGIVLIVYTKVILFIPILVFITSGSFILISIFMIIKTINDNKLKKLEKLEKLEELKKKSEFNKLNNELKTFSDTEQSKLNNAKTIDEKIKMLKEIKKKRDDKKVEDERKRKEIERQRKTIKGLKQDFINEKTSLTDKKNIDEVEKVIGKEKPIALETKDEFSVKVKKYKKAIEDIKKYVELEKGFNGLSDDDKKKILKGTTIKLKIEALNKFKKEEAKRKIEEEKRIEEERKRIEEEKRKIEEEKKRKEEEKKRKEEERKRIEEEKKKKEEERKRIEEEKRKEDKRKKEEEQYKLNVQKAIYNSLVEELNQDNSDVKDIISKKKENVDRYKEINKKLRLYLKQENKKKNENFKKEYNKYSKIINEHKYLLYLNKIDKDIFNSIQNRLKDESFDYEVANITLASIINNLKKYEKTFTSDDNDKKGQDENIIELFEEIQNKILRLNYILDDFKLKDIYKENEMLHSDWYKKKIGENNFNTINNTIKKLVEKELKENKNIFNELNKEKINNLFKNNEDNIDKIKIYQDEISKILNEKTKEDSNNNNANIGSHINENNIEEENQKSKVCGLNNIENTCFMNSGLQAIINTKIIRDIYLNQNNKLIEELNNAKKQDKKRFKEIIKEIIKEKGSITKKDFEEKLNSSYGIAFNNRNTENKYRVFSDCFDIYLNKNRKIEKVNEELDEIYQYRINFVTSMKNLLREYLNSEKTSFEPNAFHLNFSRILCKELKEDPRFNNDFYKKEQCDATEFLAKFYQIQEKILESIGQRDKIAGLQYAFSNMITYKDLDNKQEITKTIGASDQEQGNMFFNLPINGNSIEDCYKNYNKEEILKGENQYEYKEGSKVNAVKKIAVAKAPEIFNIFLTRFSPKKNGGLEKNNNVVEVNDGLEIDGVSYSLISVIMHSGNLRVNRSDENNKNGGHYYAFVKKGDVWFEANDSSISEKKWKDIKDIISGKNVKFDSGYGFVYRKIKKDNAQFLAPSPEFLELKEKGEYTRTDDEIIALKQSMQKECKDNKIELEFKDNVTSIAQNNLNNKVEFSNAVLSHFHEDVLKKVFLKNELNQIKLCNENLEIYKPKISQDEINKAVQKNENILELITGDKNRGRLEVESLIRTIKEIINIKIKDKDLIKITAEELKAYYGKVEESKKFNKEQLEALDTLVKLFECAAENKDAFRKLNAKDGSFSDALTGDFEVTGRFNEENAGVLVAA